MQCKFGAIIDSYTYIHYAPLMISLKVAHRKHTYVPLILSYGYMKKMMCASYYVVKGSTQKHPLSPISTECVPPSVKSLTERSVCLYTYNSSQFMH